MADRRDLAALVVAFLVAAGCTVAGFWQLDRLRQRRERTAVVLAARALPPLVLTGGVPLDSARDRRVRARGRYDYGRERLWRPRSYDGVPGVDLVTPLRLPDGSAVLVDRGWAPSPDAYHVDREAYREGDSGAVLGLAMRSPRSRGDVDPAMLRDSLPYPLLPFVVQQVPSDSPTVPPPAAALRRWPIPELSNGPHLSYAIQWFSFAVIIAVGSLALARKRAAEAELALRGRGGRGAGGARGGEGGRGAGYH